MSNQHHKLQELQYDLAKPDGSRRRFRALPALQLRRFALAFAALGFLLTACDGGDDAPPMFPDPKPDPSANFSLTPKSRIVINASKPELVAALSAPQGWAQYLRYASGFNLEIKQNIEPAPYDIVLVDKPDQTFLDAAKNATTQIKSGDNTASKPITETVLRDGYQYELNGKGAVIKFAQAPGGLNGFIALVQRIMNDGNKVGEHKDAGKASGLNYPAFESRTIFLDVGRIFMPVDQLIGYMQKMSFFRLNELHLHLSDYTPAWPDGKDTGWFRLYSPTHEGLKPSDDKYYTEADWQRLEDAAARYGIKIIPEIDTPGHATPIVNYLKLEEGFESGIIRLEDDTATKIAGQVADVIKTFRPWFKSGIFHVGGDETGGNSESATAKYINELARLLTESENGKQIIKEVRAWRTGRQKDDLIDKSVNLQYWTGLPGIKPERKWTSITNTGIFYFVPTGQPYCYCSRNVDFKIFYNAYMRAIPDYASLGAIPNGLFLANWNDVTQKEHKTVDFINAAMSKSLPLMGLLVWTAPGFNNQARSAEQEEADVKKLIPSSQELSSYWVRERFPNYTAQQAYDVLMKNARHRRIKQDPNDGRKDDLEPGPADADFMVWDTEDMAKALEPPPSQ